MPADEQDRLIENMAGSLKTVPKYSFVQERMLSYILKADKTWAENSGRKIGKRVRYKTFCRNTCCIIKLKFILILLFFYLNAFNIIMNDQSELDLDEKKPRKKIVKTLYFIGGTISLILGIIGIALPILPTTPFLLLAAACYARSSQRFYNWLINNRILGSYIRNYLEGKGMPIKVKIFTISLLWITILISAFFFIQILWVRIVLIIIAIAVTIHIILIRPKNKEKNNE